MKFEYKITLAYLLVGTLWILFSDEILHYLVTDPDIAARLQTFKGWFYVMITGILFYAFLKRHLERLRAEEMKAKESDRLKTTFLQNMSHEIRTPMNGIIGFTELLKNENLSEKEKSEYLRIISDNSATLFNIVNEILDISMIESGTNKINIRKVSLNEVTREMFLHYNSEIKEGIDFSAGYGLKEGDDLVLADLLKLKQVLANLISNSIKFVDAGFIKFGYTIKGAEIEFYVKDSGIGISRESQEHIFDRFIKDDTTKTRLYDGVGLGLAICKGLVELLGGRIWLESEQGKGSQFYFTIPYVKVDSAPLVPDNEKAKKLALNKLTVLLAEDNIPNQKYITQALSRSGITVITAGDGREALDKCVQNNDIDVVLMDIKMPVMDGYEVVKEVRKSRPDLYIIAQTAYALNEREKAISAGFNDYITKPFKADQLIEAVSKYRNK
jgi:signal transduction histidine kinase